MGAMKRYSYTRSVKWIWSFVMRTFINITGKLPVKLFSLFWRHLISMYFCLLKSYKNYCSRNVLETAFTFNLKCWSKPIDDFTTILFTLLSGNQQILTWSESRYFKKGFIFLRHHMADHLPGLWQSHFSTQLQHWLVTRQQTRNLNHDNITINQSS